MLQEEITYRDQQREMVLRHHPRAQSEVQKRVQRFMEEAGQQILEEPGDPGRSVRELGARLILEEAVETIESLGFRVNQIQGGKLDLIALDDSTFDLEGAVDGCLDTEYVCQWTLLAMGARDIGPMLEVCDANDRKFGPGSYKDERGKVRKPEGWVGPDISGALAAQRRGERG